jgi:hypothetical protein
MNLEPKSTSFIYLIRPRDSTSLVVSHYFDLEKFAELTGDFAEIQKKTAKAYIEFTPPLLYDIHNAVLNLDVPRISKLLHKLKASTSLFCMESLFVEIETLEREASGVSTSGYLMRIEKLADTIYTLIEEIKIYEAGLNA